MSDFIINFYYCFVNIYFNLFRMIFKKVGHNLILEYIYYLYYKIRICPTFEINIKNNKNKSKLIICIHLSVAKMYGTNKRSEVCD